MCPVFRFLKGISIGYIKMVFNNHIPFFYGGLQRFFNDIAGLYFAYYVKNLLHVYIGPNVAYCKALVAYRIVVVITLLFLTKRQAVINKIHHQITIKFEFNATDSK